MDPAIWVVATATVLSGFFALNSFSLRSIRWARLEEALSGSRGRRRLDKLEACIKPLQLTLSLCKALAYLVLVAGMVHILLTPGGDGDWGQAVLAIAISGAIIAVIGVAIPHAWASYAGEGVLAVTYPVLIGLLYLLWPITWIMQAFDVPIRRLSGQSEPTEEQEEEEAKQDILHAAVEGQAGGAVDAAEVEMIESVMELADTDAAEIMTPRTDIFALPVDMSWKDAAHEIHERGHSRVPVYEENLDNIIGIVYAKDLLRHVGSGAEMTLEPLCRKPFLVPETKELDDLLREFKTRKVHVAIVVDEYGGTSGLVTLEDVLEEIVGDVADEYDPQETPQVRRINETTAEVDGRLSVDELNDLLGLDVPEDEDYDTVAGFVVSELGYIPSAEETVTAAGAEFTILEADERRVIKIRVRKRIDEDAS